MRRWRERHPDEHAAEARAFYARHKKRLDARIAAYHRAHPEVGRAKANKYRARRAAAEGSFTPEQWLRLVKAYGGRCAYCGEKAPLVVEHVVPVSRGGTNYIENIVPACQPCNARKHRLTDGEFCTRLRSEGRRVRPKLRMALCPKHQKEQGGDHEDGQQA
jgi:5-methylcytosine-specific restriction endonuclease McrA